jgi:hypothetical protein
VTREKDYGHRIVHAKTELTKSLEDHRLAADLLSKSHLMVGFPVATRQKGMKRTTKKAQSPPVDAPVDTPGIIPDTPGASPSEALEPAGGAPVPKETPVAPSKAPSRLSGSGMVLADLDPGDVMMVEELVQSLRAARAFFPKLNRKQFLQTFIEGGRYIED